MNWLDVARAIAPLAPTLGSVLGGFIPIPGGALALQALGTIVAKKFGVDPTPQAVSDILARTQADVAIEKLRQASAVAIAEIDGYARVVEAESRMIAATTAEVNATMRVEAAAENRHWFYTGWRPACGWLFIAMASAFGVLLIAATFAGVQGNDRPLAVMATAWPIYAVYFGALAAMVGVYVVARSKDKETIAAIAATRVADPVPVPRPKPPLVVSPDGVPRRGFTPLAPR
jgi:hypothetical protein